MEYILILGATSDIGKSLAKEYSKNNFNLYLTSRNSKNLKEFSLKLEKKYNNTIKCFNLDILNLKEHEKLYRSFKKKPFGVISTIGYLGDQHLAESDSHELKKIIFTNYFGLVNFLNLIATDFEQRGCGFIIGISSVAGDRGRRSNYIYGSSKSGLTAYLSGLRSRLFPSNVHVLTVKPGFVYTKMTKHLNLPKRLSTTPDHVASQIFKAQQKQKNIVYIKRVWFIVMIIIKIIPESVFKKLKL